MTTDTDNAKRFPRWEGWTLEGQIERLEYLASVTAPNNAATAKKLREWIEHLKVSNAKK